MRDHHTVKNTVQLLQYLKSGDFVSGSSLAERFNVSRASISSWVQDLEDYGLIVHKVRGKGYRLADPIQLLDKNHIMSAIESRISKSLNIIDVSLETESTNKTALNGIYSDSQWNLYSTEYQSSGRGRRGREWVSPLGASLMFSLGSKRQWDLDVLYLASILSGLACAKVLKKHSQKKVSVKWPNDVYIEQSKVAGILCELKGSPQDEALLVVGMGINIENAPPNTNVPAISLRQVSSASIDRSQLLAELLDEIVSDLEYAQKHGVQELMKIWPQYDCLFGCEVKVIQGDTVQEGIAQGVDDRGQLILKKADGSVQSFNGGEVSVRWV